MTDRNAMDALEASFDRKAAARRDLPLVGIFGNGLPYALIAAAGCTPVDVKGAPDGTGEGRADSIVSTYLEPFIDDYARRFLHRLAAGDFADMAALVFPRDDSAALTAYQYARELRRQGILASSSPGLILWNLVHGNGEAIRSFNRRQAEVLREDLAGAGGRSVEGAFEGAQFAERERAEALARLEALVTAEPPVVSGSEAFRWRNAGRYLDAGDHAALIHAACVAATARPSVRRGHRIGLVGTALDEPRVYDAIETFGTIVCDLQPFGSVWPGPSGQASASVDAVVDAEAGDPLAARARPELAPLDALVARLVAARCDFVVAQYDQHDDSFGWDLPGLTRRLGDHGLPLVDLGFRDYRPDGAWLDAATSRIRSVVETTTDA